MGMATPPRKPIPTATELLVLDRSRRRCALCFQLNGDLTEKHGQIAHLDQNPANFAEDNLAFLCLTHHSIYDSKTRQHKNYTMAEAKKARDDLHRSIELGRHLSATAIAPMYTENDRQIMTGIERKLTGRPIHFYRTNDFSHSFRWSDVEPVIAIAELSEGAEHEFLDHELELQRKVLVETAVAFAKAVSINTFPSDHNMNFNGISNDWTEDERDRAIDEMNTAATTFCAAYDALIRMARRKLGLQASGNKRELWTTNLQAEEWPNHHTSLRISVLTRSIHTYAAEAQLRVDEISPLRCTRWRPSQDLLPG
jgi:hypothetical protein